MKRNLGLLLLTLLLAGCDQTQKITDVGNPQPEEALQAAKPVPSLDEMQGNYQEKRTQASATPGGGGGGSPAIHSSVVGCQSNDQALKNISVEKSTGKIILENFLGYAKSTQRITANYDQGNISFELVNNEVDISCAGRATIEQNQISIDLGCDVAKPVAHKCAISFFK